VKNIRFAILGSVVLAASQAVAADGPFQFYSVIPCRVIDTRVSGGSLAPGEIRNFLITGRCGIPSTAKMAALNFTVVGPTAEGHVAAYPYNSTDPSAVPPISTVNWTTGEIAIANGSVVSLAANSTYNISVHAAGARLDLVIDVTGYIQ
jgi:hypothetical protein